MDPTDHATFHPGLWLAFGDLGGADNWRNRARVEHERFVEEPAGGSGRGTFAVANRYLGGDGATICREICRYRILVRPSGYLLIAASEFASDSGDFTFGDQEEMGFGVRVATPLSVEEGGRLRNSDNREGEREVWGQTALWCDYSGTIDGRHVGITLMPDPKNFRRSWFHARDSGLLVANPFGREAFTKGEKSRVVVRRGETFRLGFGALFHGSPAGKEPDLTAAYGGLSRTALSGALDGGYQRGRCVLPLSPGGEGKNAPPHRPCKSKPICPPTAPAATGFFEGSRAVSDELSPLEIRINGCQELSITPGLEWGRS